MDLAHDPRPRRRSRKLSGSEDEWRLRVGDYRAIYAVDDEGRESSSSKSSTAREVTGKEGRDIDEGYPGPGVLTLPP